MFRATVIWINNKALVTHSLQFYQKSFELTPSHSSINMPLNFGIPAIYFPNSSTVEPRCFIGINTISLGGVILPPAYQFVVNYFYTNTTHFNNV